MFNTWKRYFGRLSLGFNLDLRNAVEIIWMELERNDLWVLLVRFACVFGR